MNTKQPKKSTQGRKPASESQQKVLIRERLPANQVYLAKVTCERLGLKLSEFIEQALKEEIYRAQLHMATSGRNPPTP
jgi:hypothetical protein